MNMTRKTNIRIWRFCFCLLVVNLHYVHGLRLTEVIIPSNANLGSTVTMGCKFDLGRAKLYSVKWYKNEYEFFRFMPDNRPQTQVFILDGVTLDESESGMNSVTLRDLRLSSSGTYSCEVSTEAPSFETVFDNRNMTVVAYPEFDPEIHGVQTSYTEGDYITVNCTSSPSYPAPRIDWYINGVKADAWLLERSPVASVGERYSSSVGIRFLAEKQHFRGVKYALRLECRASADGLPSRQSGVNLYLDVPLTNQKFSQDWYRNTSPRQTLYCTLPCVLTFVLFIVEYCISDHYCWTRDIAAQYMFCLLLLLQLFVPILYVTSV